MVGYVRKSSYFINSTKLHKQYFKCCVKTVTLSNDRSISNSTSWMFLYKSTYPQCLLILNNQRFTNLLVTYVHDLPIIHFDMASLKLPTVDKQNWHLDKLF